MSNYVVLNEFVDKYTKTLYKKGSVLNITEQRAKEIEEVDKNLIQKEKVTKKK